MAGCLDDDTAVAYVLRTIEPVAFDAVTAHLDRCDACMAIVCAIARAPGDTDGGDGPSAPPTDEPQTAGRYTLIEMIGRGGMGAVYRARDPQLDRDVALKIVRGPRYAEAADRERLSREARAMAKVRHPNVVAVHDAGELADGVFIAMELVVGETLGAWLRAEPRSWHEIVAMFLAAGRGLAAAHAAGIVHRDFKPANVLVDRDGRPLVADFGIASLGTAQSGAAGTDEPVGVAGTPSYMAPEQRRGEPIDARSDQFSFGVALGAALAAAAAPPRVHAVAERARSRVAAERYADMPALLDALAGAAKPRVSRRARIAIAVGIAGVAAAPIAAVVLVHGAPHASARVPAPADVPGVAAAPWLSPPKYGRRYVVVPPFANHTHSANLADTLDLVIADSLEHGANVQAMAGAELAELEDRLGSAAGSDAAAAAAAAIAAKRGGDVPVVRGEIDELAGGGFAIELATADRRVELTERARSEDDALAAAARLAARLRAALGDPDAPADAASAVAPWTRIDAVHAFAAARLHALRDQPADALAAFSAATAAEPDFALAHYYAALVLFDRDQRADSLAELQLAVDIDHQLPPARRLSPRQRLHLESDYYSVQGRYIDASSAAQRLLVLDPEDTLTRVNVTSTAIDSGDWTLALQFAKDAADHSPEINVARANLVLAEIGVGQLADAERDGVAMLDAVSPTLVGYRLVALAQILRGHRDAALATLDKLAAAAPDDKQLAAEARADLAIYEGRFADAAAAIAPYREEARAAHQPLAVRNMNLQLARIELARGNRVAAAAAARAAMGSSDARPEYLAAQLALAAGDRAGVADKIRAWAKAPLLDRRLYAKLLAGDLARADGKLDAAIDAYTEAGQLGLSWWMIHARLGLALLDAHRTQDAIRELAWCAGPHRGEATVWLLPSLALLPEIDQALARAKAVAAL